MIRRRGQTRSNHERWLISYADFITLLFAFFVVLYATAQIDRKKVGMLSESIQQGFQEMGMFGAGGETEHTGTGHVPLRLAATEDVGLREIQNELGNSLTREVARGEVVVQMTRDGLVVSLREVGFFDSGSAQLRVQAADAFNRVANVLRRNARKIRVEGHTDDVPIHNRRFQSNWELSTARATEVVRVLITEYGYAPELLSASGYAEFHPSMTNQTEYGRQANRRVDIVILSNVHGLTVDGR